MAATEGPGSRRDRQHRDRQRALDLLFEADQRARAGEQVDVLDLMRRRAAGQDELKPMREYATEIVTGVDYYWDEIDEIIAENAHGWTIDRMPAVDRSILRIGVWEILWNDDMDDAAAVRGAADLAGELSTDESPAFVNGLLGQIQRNASELRARVREQQADEEELLDLAGDDALGELVEPAPAEETEPTE